ncbi:MAG: cystathionine beta-lyase [Sphingomicrobium sp.]
MSDDPEGPRKRTGIRPDTKIISAGRRDQWLQGMVNVPVSRTSTVLFEDVEAMNAAYPPEDGRLSYGRNGTPTQWSLAEALTELEPGAAGTRLFPSGAAAVAFALSSVLAPGDELLMVDSVYGPSRRFCDHQLKTYGIGTRYYDPLASAVEVQALLSDSTRAIFMESPGSLTFEVQDVPGICEIAKAHGIVTLLDNTWATPLFFQALSKGVDLAILACTKYVSGHSDVMLGSVTATAPLWEQLSGTSSLYGQCVSPDDAFLAARGLRTMGVRLRRHEDSAIKIARWLQDQAQVANVLHPAFKDSPGHAFWKRDFTGSTGLFSIVLKDADDAAANRFVENLRLFGIGYSWGGFESLALPVHPHRARTVRREKPAGTMVRLHIGLEDPDDLIADLAEGLKLIG